MKHFQYRLSLFCFSSLLTVSAVPYSQRAAIDSIESTLAPLNIYETTNHSNIVKNEYIVKLKEFVNGKKSVDDGDCLADSFEQLLPMICS